MKAFLSFLLNLKQIRDGIVSFLIGLAVAAGIGITAVVIVVFGEYIAILAIACTVIALITIMGKATQEKYRLWQKKRLWEKHEWDF